MPGLEDVGVGVGIHMLHAPGLQAKLVLHTHHWRPIHLTRGKHNVKFIPVKDWERVSDVFNKSLEWMLLPTIKRVESSYSENYKGFSARDQCGIEHGYVVIYDQGICKHQISLN